MPGFPDSAAQSVFHVAGGAATLCVAALAGSVAVAGRFGLSPGRRALLHWAPIATSVVAARAMGFGDIAMGIVFGTSVAILSTAVGSLCTVAPVGPAPARWKRIWPFTLLTALIVFVAGFNGLLTWVHGVALALEGLVILSLWRDGSTDAEWATPTHAKPPRLPDWAAHLAGGSSLLLAVLGTWLAVRGTMGMTHLRVHASPGAVGASLLSLVLATPLVQSGRGLALAGTTWIPMTAQVGVVLLNLCVLLPLLSAAPYAASVLRAIHWTPRVLIDWESILPHATPFPLAVWRIDSVVLILLSTLLLPVSAGKWNLGREEGVILLGAYCVYLLAVTVAGV